MAHFAFVAPPLAGHVNPLLAVAAELMRRGHRASFVHQADAARHLSGTDVPLVAVGAASHPAGDLDATVARMARLNGFIGLRPMLHDVARTTDMLCRELPDALRDMGVDAIVADQTEAAGALVAEHLGLPYVSTATALPLNRERDVPPPFTAWPYDPSERGRRRNDAGYRISDWLMRPVADVIEHHAARFGLGGRRRSDQCFSPLAQVAQAVPGLDFPRRALPAQFRYLGPFRPLDVDSDDASLPVDDGRPLVFCSLGTLQGSRAAIFRHIAHACADLDVQLVLAHGGLLRGDQAASLPGSPIVRAFVPQRQILRRAAVAITHAGFNTVLDALTFGVPMVAIPLAFEQPATAARLRCAGAAEVLSPRWLTRGKLVAALRRVLQTPSYTRQAALLAHEIREAPGATGAADIIETAVCGAGATTARQALDDARGDSRSESM